MRKTHIFTAAVMSGLFGVNAAMAHPHVFAQARLELKAAPDGTIEALHHVWRFDELFTSTVILEFDTNQNNALDDDELDEVANTIAGSISEFSYFQNISVGGKDVTIKNVQQMTVGIEDGQMLLLFETVPFTPIKLSDNPVIGIFDPTFYTAIEFYSEDDMVIIDAPSGCSHKMVVPDADEAIAQNAQNLTDAFYGDSDGNDMSKILATRMEVSCAAAG